jgi:hypothetical protein
MDEGTGGAFTVLGVMDPRNERIDTLHLAFNLNILSMEYESYRDNLIPQFPQARAGLQNLQRFREFIENRLPNLLQLYNEIQTSMQAFIALVEANQLNPNQVEDMMLSNINQTHDGIERLLDAVIVVQFGFLVLDGNRSKFNIYN